MGKRSSFERVERDFYPTPLAAVVPLMAHLPESFTFAEPCAGDARLAFHLYSLSNTNGNPTMLSDIEPRDGGVEKMDVFDFIVPPNTDYIITNPPWNRKILHPLIEHLSNMAPTWLLFDADWMHTKQSAPFMGRLHKIVSVGRVQWIEDSKSTGKDNSCWYLFDAKYNGETEFYGRNG